MTNKEFAEIVGYVTAGCGKALSVESQMVYFDCLGDLPADVLRIAAKRVLMEHVWSTFPSVAELREAASETARGEVTGMEPAKAWEMAWEAIGRIDPDIDGSMDRALAKLPPVVAETVNSLGVCSLCYGKDPVPVVRAQFLKAFEQFQARDRRKALFPPATVAAIEEIRERKAIPASSQVAGVLAGIGKAVDAA